MAGMIGMNVEEVRALSRQLHTAAEQVKTIQSQLTNKLGGTTWVGQDQARFKSEWDGTHSTNLRNVARLVLRYGFDPGRPLLITTDPAYYTAVMGIRRLAAVLDGDTQWNLVMAGTILAGLPPVLVIVLMQRLFVKGLVETEK